MAKERVSALRADAEGIKRILSDYPDVYRDIKSQ
jgi:hypothetical protein